jgi:hypothetical protein
MCGSFFFIPLLSSEAKRRKEGEASLTAAT